MSQVRPWFPCLLTALCFLAFATGGSNTCAGEPPYDFPYRNGLYGTVTGTLVLDRMKIEVPGLRQMKLTARRQFHQRQPGQNNATRNQDCGQNKAGSICSPVVQCHRCTRWLPRCNRQRMVAAMVPALTDVRDVAHDEL